MNPEGREILDFLKEETTEAAIVNALADDNKEKVAQKIIKADAITLHLKHKYAGLCFLFFPVDFFCYLFIVPVGMRLNRFYYAFANVK